MSPRISHYGYKDYSAIKLLVDQYFNLKEGESYDAFIQKLTRILRV
jgi:hypothetical protein